MILNGGLWRVWFSNVCKLLILEREMGLEPTTSSLRSWHSTTELLPLTLPISYFTVRQGLSGFRRQSIPSTKSLESMGSDRKVTSKTTSKLAGAERNRSNEIQPSVRPLFTKPRIA